MATLGLYVQVPFCQAKCTYCNFPAGVFPHVARERYFQALECEILDVPTCFERAGIERGILDRPVDSIYIGGGTPSMFDPTEVSRILENIRARFTICSGCETTLEVDPETVSPEKACAWLEAGINRVSLGAQSFEDRELKAVGRRHRRSDIEHSVAMLREAGAENVSLDLIAGLPYQTWASWEETISEAERLRPEHISLYMLEIDEKSRLGREALASGRRYSAAELVDPDLLADFYQNAVARLRSHGYRHYEISNFALPGRESRHNLKYWNREPYLGFGSAAHSFDGARRWSNVADPAEYAIRMESRHSAVETMSAVTEREAQEEFFFLGLRQIDGVPLEAPGMEISRDFQERVERLVSQGLLIEENGRVRLSPQALVVSNAVFAEFVG